MAAKSEMQSENHHSSGCRTAKAVFGLLVLLVGLYGVLVEMGMVKSPVSFWSMLVVLVGLGLLAKSAAGGKCPKCA